MDWKKASILFVVVSVVLYAQHNAFSSDAYFTHQDIKKRMLRAVEESKESIDIAVSDITSKDILNTLRKAQQRGVQVRIVAGRRRTLTSGLMLNLYKEKQLATKIVVQEGIMHNNFAIFDCKLLMIGSYNWKEKVGKFNHGNAFFTEEAKIVIKYQKEFDRLFHEGTAPKVENIAAEGEEGFKKTEGTSPGAVPHTFAMSGKRVIVSKYGVVIVETNDGYIDMGFEEFNNIFGMVSDLSDEQKENLWSRCIGKKVRWNGVVNYIGWGLVTGWMMGVTHGDTSVEVKLNPANKGHFSPVKYGNTVTYTGKLDSRVTRIFPYKLEDGDVLGIENTEPKPLSRQELIENPDVIPISQGPKRIFLVESFEDLNALFGSESSLSEIQKDEAWGKYQGKYVSWTGQIVYKNLNVASGLRIGMMQKENESVELKISLSKKDKILKFQDGETVVYTGRLTTRCGNNFPYILEDGDITTIK
ncbi:MAG: hypothetical protein DWB56_04800 [Candidatus Jettenia sp.]|uniref:phospholipase D n=1 Tax=Candidatus Jettenia caeni TaxID=247490 RepID=I3IIE4_9BACT|nr:phospholipase D-like domain-containing protein [Candidatus Jettenia sp. AMX1]MBC6928274.1 hypothetical protein [Candidatus Jettenia sp.]NUN23063.1 hypothetical protein [Candidatus Jettenia caeni]KAA0249965.1 MAG: hypothetical protein EDM77_06780 [Candidatus Jettenia sp. AMX1]MCE7880444.1 hypothetical protein [Candidatus Jettenia sp. AMX1]MCQ3926252.1 hypothetical protein [Candidatus Jettenia sp.]